MKLKNFLFKCLLSFAALVSLPQPLQATPINNTTYLAINDFSPSLPADTPTKAPIKVTNSDVNTLKTQGSPALIVQAIALSFLALIPFVLMLITPFAKFVMVFSLLRNALGVQQVPPNQVVNGIALILSLFVMFPVSLQMYDASSSIIEKEQPESLFSEQAPAFLIKVANHAKEPLREFLQKNTLPAHQKNFYKIAYKMMPEKYHEDLGLDDFIVLGPAYITSQVKSGFEIGALIFLPFFVIDLVVSNILLAMGMMMLSPVTISMPLKIFLLVMLDGWSLLTEGLISSYR